MASISIAVVSDTKQAVASVKDLSAEYSSLVDHLKTLGPAGQSAASALQEDMRRAQLATQDAAAASKQLVEGINQAKLAAAQEGAAFEMAGEQVNGASSKVRKIGDDMSEAGRKTEEGSKIGEAALMNLGFSATSVGEVLTGPGGTIDAVGQFAAFLGPALGPAAGTVVTLAGLGLALLGQQMDNTAKAAENASPAVKDFVGAMEDGTAASNDFDAALRAWAKDATDYGGQALSTVAEASKTANVSFSDFAEAITSKSIPAMAEQERQLTTLKKKYDEAAAAADNRGKASDIEQSQKDVAASKAIDTLNASLGAQIDNVKKAQAAEQVLADQMGFSISQYKSYGTVLQEASDQKVNLTKAQKDSIEAAVKEGASTSDLKRQIDDYASAVADAKQDQDNWNKSVSGAFQSAGSASKDWAEKSKVDFDVVAKNLQEADDQFQRMPGDIQKALSGGLTQAGLKFLESLPNGEQIIDQIGLGDKSSQKLITAANKAGQDAATKLGDGLSKVPPFEVKVKADTSEVKTDIEKATKGHGTATVNVKADTKQANADIDKTASAKHTATVKAEADTSKAKSELDTVTKPRTVKVVAELDHAQFDRDLRAALRDRTMTVTVNQRPGSRVI